VQAGLKLSGRYVLQALLGCGGMGEVWRGVDEQLDRPVAIKVLREHLADPELAGRFRREARIAARLQHPGITVVHDVGSDNGQLFIVMELLHGRDLAAVLAEAPAGLPIDVAVSLAVQAAEALRAAHAGQVVHRDLKPANLFVLDGGQLKICDFGIARAIDATTQLTAVGQAIGTPAYMSPEQCRGQQVDERSDLYSLGCVLYELLTGQPPFTGGQPLAILSQHLYAAPVALRTVRAGVPPGLDRLVLDMLAKDPARRPAGAGHVITALRAWQYTPTVQVEPTAKASSQLSLDQPGPGGDASGFEPMGSEGTVSANLARLPSALISQSAAIRQVPRTEAERTSAEPGELIMPFYLACGVPRSMRDDVAALTEGLKRMRQAVVTEPAVDDVSRFCIVSFSDTAKVLMPLGRMSESTIPTLHAEGGTNYGAAFRMLAHSIERDTAGLAKRGYKVYRPCVLFFTDSAPEDYDWYQTFTRTLTYDRYTGRGLKAYPIFVPYGFGAAPEDVLRQLAYPPERGRWYHAKNTDVEAALTGILPLIMNDVITPAGQPSAGYAEAHSARGDVQ
jgi:serine/threonine protein kinase/uncharacterized protein YegL